MGALGFNVLGVPVVLGISSISIFAILYVVITKPDVVDYWRKLFWGALASIFDGFGRQAAKAAVEADTNHFLQNEVLAQVVDTDGVRIRLSWVEGPEDARLQGDGNIIVRIRRDRDQTRNKLLAFATAVPHLVYPRVRPHLDTAFIRATDLSLVRILAEVLGQRATTIFHTEILQPVLAGDQPLAQLLRIMQEMHEGGLFEAVLLQELADLSDAVHARLPGPDLAQEATAFAQWLRDLAVRRAHDESGDLCFLRKYFKVAFILASKAQTAAKGTYPYERRLVSNLALGAESLYLQCLMRDQVDVTGEIAAAFDADNRVLTRRRIFIRVNREDGPIRVPLYHYRRNNLYIGAGTFSHQLSHSGIVVGCEVAGRVRDVFENKARVSVDGFDGEIRSRDLAWGYHGTVPRILRVGDELPFRVIDIFDERGLLQLSRKHLMRSPWVEGPGFAVQQAVRGTITEIRPNRIVVRLSMVDESFGEIYGTVPTSEWSWLASDNPAWIPPSIGAEVDLEIIAIGDQRDELLLSRRVRECSDWPLAKQKYPHGAKARARVLQADHEGLYCEIEPGVFGRIARHDLLKQGHELVDFEQTVARGTMYDVIIKRHRDARRFFTLDLARNTDPAMVRPGV